MEWSNVNELMSTKLCGILENVVIWHHNCEIEKVALIVETRRKRSILAEITKFKQRLLNKIFSENLA